MANEPVSRATRAKLARSVLTNNLRLRKGEHVIIEAWTHTLPWAVAFAREARRLGAQTLVPYEDETAWWDAVADGEEDVLGKAPAHEWAALGKTDVYIHMWGPGDRVRLNALPPKQAGRLFEFNPRWYATAAKTGLRGARMEIGRPFPTLARAYGVDESEWRDQVIRATMVSPDALCRTAAPITRALERGKSVRIHDEEGTDLTLGLARRRALSNTGRLTPEDLKRPFRMLLNLPAGSIRVALDETVAEGTIVANRTSYYDDGKATGGVLRFHHGKLTKAEFTRGGERFDETFKTGGKGRDRPGLLSIGLNPHLHDTPQLEDVELGAVMVSLGNNRNAGGKNAAPFFGWVVNQGATVEIDGHPLSVRR
ncbi:MAG TPA: aminopeptidase [Thermoplasmata archaeon]|nr:aminopeptidase [Thermoplasmata archaeon]